MRSLLCLCCLFIGFYAHAQRITGLVLTHQGKPLPFASVSLKNEGAGAAANVDGEYILNLQPGQHQLVFRRFGFAPLEQTVTLEPGQRLPLTVRLQALPPGSIQYQRSEGRIVNPAFDLMQAAIARADSNHQLLGQLQANVYLKGQLKLRAYPRRFMGQDIDFETGDTALNKQIYLTETIGRYSRQHQPLREKTEVFSTRESGAIDAYGFDKINWFSFYDNQIRIGDLLHPRGFVSPLSKHAFQFYQFRLLGSFEDEGRQILRIEVLPRRSYEPSFRGTLHLDASSYQIHSLRLSLAKKQLLQVLDSLVVEQTMSLVGGQWVLRQQVLYPYLHLLKFRADGGFLQVQNHVTLNPTFPNNFFANTVRTYADSANRKPFTYWDTMRPLPLQPEELADYRFRDSVEAVRSRPAFMDSVDWRAARKPRLFNLFLKGFSVERRTRDRKIVLPALLDVFTYNTVEGFAIRFSPDYYKSFRRNREDQLYLSPHLQYGFANNAFNAHLTGHYRWGGKKLRQLGWSGGRRMFQFNNEQPIAPRDNTSSTLLFENNWMKIYYSWTGRLSYSRGLADGLVATLQGEYQDRMPLENNSGAVIFNRSKTEFSPNRPWEVALANMPRHQAFVASAELSWQPGSRFEEHVNRRENLGSRWPLFRLQLAQAVKNFAGSDADYTRWRLRVDDVVRLGLGGRFEYNAAMGGFLRDKQVFLPDYQHYFSTQSFLYTPNSMMFLLPTFYQFSNRARFNAELHFDYHLAGLLTNKIPGFNRLNWFLVAGTNALYLSDGTRYAETLVGLENILKIVRVDYVWGRQNNGWQRSGIRITLSGFAAAKKDD